MKPFQASDDAPTLGLARHTLQPARHRAWAVAGGLIVAVALSLYFWFPLWTGGGLVGSDVYAYSLPQKAYFAERLQAGELPLWHNRIGHGYPLVAESQTGVFYPPNWIFYRALFPLLDLNGAFSGSLIFHYVLAFLWAMLYARQLGLSLAGAGLAALIFTYAWFPPRVCLEWSIVGGAWIPLALWSAESFLQTRFWRYAFLLTATLAIQMLAGHFVLAFITQLTVTAYVPLRLWLPSTRLFTVGCVKLAHEGVSAQAALDAGNTPSQSETLAGERRRTDARTCSTHPTFNDPGSCDSPGQTNKSRIRAGIVLAFAVVAAFLVAAVQLLPTWELKQLSQRATVTSEHDPAIGSIPLKYFSQLVLPWVWYPDESSFVEAAPPGAPRTNRVEAHLYFGLIPLFLILWRIWQWQRHGDRRLSVWIILGLAALVYTTGWLVPLTRHLPGFSFFEGPGRFGVVTTLAAGLIAGSGYDCLVKSLCESLCRKWRAAPGHAPASSADARFQTTRLFAIHLLLGGTLFIGTVVDLGIVSRLVTYAVIVPNPPAKYLADSPLRQVLSKLPQPVRIVSEGKNLPSLLGVATEPVYLGLTPAQYVDPATTLPEPWPFATPPTRAQLDWFHRAGVTHYLSFAPVNRRAWEASLIWEGPDQFLNAALARAGGDRFYLYELDGSRGRVAFRDSRSNQSAAIINYSANEVTIKAETLAGGQLILTDLAWPGWFVTVDGRPTEDVIVEKMYRGVDLEPGNHTVTWSYRPATLYWGAAISSTTLVILLAVAHVHYWHPQSIESTRENAGCLYH